MHSMCKHVMERVVLVSAYPNKRKYTINYVGDIPYINNNPGVMTIETMVYNDVIRILYSVLRIWGVNIVIDKKLNMVIKYQDIINLNTECNVTVNISHQRWDSIYKENVLWMNGCGNYLSVCTIGDLKMYEYDSNTLVLKRLLLLLLIDPYGFLTRMEEKINESSPQTQQFFRAIRLAIDSDLMKYMIFGELDHIFGLNSDVMRVIVIL